MARPPGCCYRLGPGLGLVLPQFGMTIIKIVKDFKVAFIIIELERAREKDLETANLYHNKLKQRLIITDSIFLTTDTTNKLYKNYKDQARIKRRSQGVLQAKKKYLRVL